MIQEKIAIASLDFDEVYRLARHDYDALEIPLSEVQEGLEERLMVIRELAYPLPVIARLTPPENESLPPLLLMLAVAGLNKIIFTTSSPDQGRSLLSRAELINREQRLGLSFSLSFVFDLRPPSA